MSGLNPDTTGSPDAMRDALVKPAQERKHRAVDQPSQNVQVQYTQQWEHHHDELVVMPRAGKIEVNSVLHGTREPAAGTIAVQQPLRRTDACSGVEPTGRLYQ